MAERRQERPPVTTDETRDDVSGAEADGGTDGGSSQLMFDAVKLGAEAATLGMRAAERIMRRLRRDA